MAFMRNLERVRYFAVADTVSKASFAIWPAIPTQQGDSPQPSKRGFEGRNMIERCFCRLKNFRRFATRYDKPARNFLAAVHLAVTVAPFDQLGLNPRSPALTPPPVLPRGGLASRSF